MSIQVFEYPAVPEEIVLDWDVWSGAGLDEDDPTVAEPAAAHESPAATALSNAEFEERLAEEARRAFEAGRQQGIQEGRGLEHEAYATALHKLQQDQADNLSDLVEKFDQERERYIHAVEHEVVKLSLAVAARILRREAQMDPLLLLGAVRVALGQLTASTQVRLRVPPAELDLWSEAITLLPNLGVRPQVVAGERMRLGDCVIETEMGSVDLGVRAQLNEIERGFFDRAGAVPADTAETAEQKA